MTDAATVPVPPPGQFPGGPNPELVMAHGAAFMTSKMVFVATEIGLFAALGPEGATAADLAARCGVPERGLRIVADVLATCGLLTSDGGRYRNSPEAEAFLTGRGPLDMRPMVRYWDLVSYPGALEATRAVRTGQGVRGPLDAAQTAAYTASVAFSTTPAGYALPDVYDFGGHRRVLDVGGGAGTMLRPVLARHPHLTGTLLDLPEVVELARTAGGPASENTAGGPASEDTAGGPASENTVSGRMALVGGDAWHDPLPEGHDAVIVAHLLHLFPPERNVALLERLRRVTPAGGRLLLVDWWRCWPVPPPVAVYGAVEFLLIGGGDTYRPDEVAGWLAATGWRLTGPRPLPVAEPSSLLVAEAD